MIKSEFKNGELDIGDLITFEETPEDSIIPQTITKKIRIDPKRFGFKKTIKIIYRMDPSEMWVCYTGYKYKMLDVLPIGEEMMDRLNFEFSIYLHESGAIKD